MSNKIQVIELEKYTQLKEYVKNEISKHEKEIKDLKGIIKQQKNKENKMLTKLQDLVLIIKKLQKQQLIQRQYYEMKLKMNNNNNQMTGNNKKKTLLKTSIDLRLVNNNKVNQQQSEYITIKDNNQVIYKDIATNHDIYFNKFNHIIKSNITNQILFNNYYKSYIQQVIDHNQPYICINYGDNSTNKDNTLYGNKNESGLIMYSVDYLLNSLENVLITLSAVELDHQIIKDLLVTTKNGNSNKLNIQAIQNHIGDINYHATNITRLRLLSSKDIIHAINFIKKKYQAKQAHALIISIDISYNNKPNKSCKIHFVNLADSNLPHHVSDIDHHEIKNTFHMLANCLTNRIQQNNQLGVQSYHHHHINYHENNLTLFLQSVLSTDSSNCSILLHINPFINNQNEYVLQTLRYADRLQ